ncbi:LysR family transcriptional regulator [Neptunomonas sp. CHC150]|uniref:LysR family transcriptional regulator n=1 Tax=Neptunomonas sp. CHC150 TaxID=2998324 RepID=UPI0025B15D4B|nr:LysR family transcriptional regulator [Neptunomonas sp. CHC150]MDN2661457.1 LysR family transcriptional regulator [Neptunomonas sp. CHC150]
MREVNLRSIDLNLLVVLEALLEERQVTKAAERLHMSQPAVSRALQRLRHTFSDPLLVRSGDGYDLSERAKQISTDVKSVLANIKQIIAEPQFDPATSKQIIQIAGPDLEMALYLSDLLGVLQDAAPLMQVELDSRPADYFEMLARDDIHFAVSGFGPNVGEDQFHRTVLGQTGLAIVMGANNPLANKEITLDEYLNARHGYVSLTGQGPAFMDTHLKELRRKRTTVLRLTSFMGVADFCETTDLLFMLPVSLIERLAIGRNVVTRPLPTDLKLPNLNIYLYWHARHHNDPMHRWVREQIAHTLNKKVPNMR